MKKLLAAMFVALLMVGCGGDGKSGSDSSESNQSSAETIDLDDKETLDGIIAEAIDWGKLQEKGEEGDQLYYAPNQQIPYTGWVKVMWGNEQVRLLAQYEDGKGDGLFTSWHENGQKDSEGNYKDGKLMTVVAWKPNGKKCPATKLIDGNGVVLWYKKDGTEELRQTYKDSIKVD